MFKLCLKVEKSCEGRFGSTIEGIPKQVSGTTAMSLAFAKGASIWRAGSSRTAT